MALDSPKWKYVLTAIDGSMPAGTGEIYYPTQRMYSDQLNGVRQASCSIPLDHPRADYLLNHDCLLKVYRRDRAANWNLLLTGDVVQTEEQSQGGIGNIIISAADPFWRVMKRLLGMAIDATTHQASGFTIGTPTTPIDLSQAMSTAMAQVNTDFPTGITLGTVTNSGALQVVGPLFAVFAGQAIQEMSSALGGPEFWVNPVEPSGAMPGTTVGQLFIGPSRGSFKHNAIFEYGFGKTNVQNYQRLRNKQGVCNHAVSLPNGWPTSIDIGDGLVTYDDSTSQNTIGRFDDIVSTDVVNKNLRTIIAHESVQVRNHAQQQITFQPVVDSGVEYPLDYGVGDVVVARAYDYSSKSFRYNGSIRVYGVQVQVDDQDAETVNLTLIPDSVSGGFAVGGI